MKKPRYAANGTFRNEQPNNVKSCAGPPATGVPISTELYNDETWEEGAKRETKEEIGLSVGELEEIGRDGEKMDVKFFKTHTHSGEPKLDKSENEKYIWINGKDVDIYNKITPNVLKMIKKEFNDEDK